MATDKDKDPFDGFKMDEKQVKALIHRIKHTDKAATLMLAEVQKLRPETTKEEVIHASLWAMSESLATGIEQIGIMMMLSQLKGGMTGGSVSGSQMN